MLPPEIRGLGFSPIETQIMEVLVSGEAKCSKELMVWDSQASENVLKVHIHHIRTKLIHSRYRIASGLENKKLVYRLTRLLPEATVPD